MNEACQLAEKRIENSISDDMDLMRRIVLKDKEAFEMYIDMYMDNIFRFCYGIVKNQELAEDITQEVFIKLWNEAEKWQPTGKVKSWLLRIAHNLSIDELRKSKPHTDIEKVSHSLVSYTALPDEEVQKNFVEEVVRDSLLVLPERQKEAVMLFYYSGCSNKEGAEVMDVSEEAFESLLARGRRKLKDVLKDMKDKI